MKVQILLSIMNEKDPIKKIKNMNIKNDYVIINQITDNSIKKVNIVDNNNIIKSLKDKGLSKSRNLAIKESNLDIGLISDDDMYYVESYKEIIENAYKKYSDADLIAFVVEHEDKNFEKKMFKEGKLNFIKSLRISSVQLTINLKSIKDNKIYFDENFGSGSKFYMGEENIFLFDCLRKGLKIYYVPKQIGILKKNSDSAWFKGYNKDYFVVKGAQFYRMSKYMYIPLILQFVFRKRKLYKDNFNIIEIVKFMLEGSREFKRNEGIKYEKK